MTGHHFHVSEEELRAEAEARRQAFQRELHRRNIWIGAFFVGAILAALVILTVLFHIVALWRHCPTAR